MDEEISLPKATLQKMIKEYLPGDVRIGGEAVEMLVNCCTEFVQLLSSEANEVSTREKKSTIQPDHVIKALQELGFAEFLEEVTAAWEGHKEESKTTNSHKAALRKTGADQAGMTEEEQIAMQQQLFAAARARSMTSVDGAAAMAAAYQAQLAALQQQQSVQQPAAGSSGAASIPMAGTAPQVPLPAAASASLPMASPPPLGSSPAAPAEDLQAAAAAGAGPDLGAQAMEVSFAAAPAPAPAPVVTQAALGEMQTDTLDDDLEEVVD